MAKWNQITEKTDSIGKLSVYCGLLKPFRGSFGRSPFVAS